MRQTVIGGLVLAIATGLLIALSGPLNLQVEHTALLGVAIGAVLGTIAVREPWERLAAFAIGLVATWVYYSIRAGFLPDAPAGRVVAVAGLIVVLVFIVWVSANRFPLWAMLLGAVSLAGAYELTYTANPTEFVAESAVALTGVLLTVAIGFAITAVLAQLPLGGGPGRHRDDDRTPSDDDEVEAHLDDMFTTHEEVRP